MCGYTRNDVDRCRLDNILLGVMRTAGFTSALADCFAVSDVVLTLGARAVAFRVGFRMIPITRTCTLSFVPNTCLPLLSNAIMELYGEGELASCRKRSGTVLLSRRSCSQLCVAISRTGVAEDLTSHPPARQPYRHPFLLTSVGISSHLFRLILLFEVVTRICAAVDTPHLSFRWIECSRRWRAKGSSIG
jgi:hypothetical protein